jgi:hypothetical protein
MSATSKVEVHLGIICFHPLHSPSFVRVYFTLKHTLYFMGLCISHFAADPMLGLWQNVYQLTYMKFHSIAIYLHGVLHSSNFFCLGFCLIANLYISHKVWLLFIFLSAFDFVAISMACFNKHSHDLITQKEC